jgi:signal transduction histidine kinase/ligand-binding sensor domain-containing protein/DNA-binding NarL/FixJ family response regulator
MKHAYLFLLLLVNLTAHSQPLSTIQHYSSDDGLSQNTVMSIIQDKKGHLWFSTWDGLNRFDGYNFTAFKTRPGDLVSLSNSRIDQIAEDKIGQIWVMTYDRKIHRFDPETGQFSLVNDDKKPIKHFPATFTRIEVLTTGSVWLLSDSEGAAKAITHPDKSIDISVYAVENGMIEGNNVYKIFADKHNNEWLLTDNGLAQLKPGSQKPNVFFFESREAKLLSGQSFFSACEGENGIWFGSIKGRVWFYEFQGDKFSLIELACNSNIADIKRIDNDRLIIATSNDGFFVYNLQTKQQKHYTTTNHPELESNVLISAYVDRFGEVWLQQNKQGITHFNPTNENIKFHPTQTEHSNLPLFHPAFFILEDINNHLWIHPLGGGFSYYNRTADRLEHFHNNPNDPARRFSNMLHSVFSDKQGNLWMCTRSKGIEKVSFLDKQFDLLKPAPNKTEPFSNDVRAVMQDNKGNHWMSTKDGMLRVFDNNKQPIGYLTQNGAIAMSGRPLDGVTYTLMQDTKGTIWIGTKGNGLFKATPMGNSNVSFSLEQFVSNTDDIYSLSNDNIYHLHEDDKGRVWVATYGGGINYIDEGRNGKTLFINHRNNLKGYPINTCFKVRLITSGPNDNLLVGSTNGLVVFNNDFVDPENISFNHYAFTTGNKNSLSNNDVHSILVTKKRDVYVATFGGGLNHMTLDASNKPSFNAYTTYNGLPSDVLLSILEDAQGHLWVTTENGLSKFDPQTGYFENYDERNFGAKVLFSESTSMSDNDGNLWFGSDMGFVVFKPADIHKSKFVPNIVLTGLSLFNKQIYPAPNGSVLTKHIDNTEELVLTHKQNVFSITYAALDMKYTDKVNYSIKLEGFDEDWKYMHKQRNATYTNLPHGKYVLRIKSTNSDGVWVDNERTIKITVLPSFWVTGWAYIIYFIGFIIIIGISGYILFVIYHLKNSVAIEHQLTELKLKFFTDISHELRTPLTLIAAPVEHMLQQDDLPQATKDELKLVERNTDRMLRLINQILDFVKIQNRKMDLRVEEIEIGQAVAKIMENFKSLANDHKIDFTLDDQTNGEVVYLDMDKFEKIVFNLLSNAFKFTNPGKSIMVILENKKDSVVFRVKDSGVGISENRRKALFERFESFLDRNIFNQPSTGIGLSLVKQLVDMHKARIEVDSKVGEGTIFSIEFFKGIGHFDNETDIIVPENMESQTIKLPCDNNDTDDDELTDTTVLVVEDNDEMRQFLRNILGKHYRVLDAPNGKEGLEIASSQIPDLIISDVMMQGIDGIELTRKLRSELHTSHIPIILLTAKTSIDSKLEGLETGADDYITKPFSTTYLLARIENLLEQRQKLQALYRSQLGVKPVEVNPSQPQIHSYDQKFLDDLTALMEKNMDNGNLVVDDLVSEMGVSRSVFFKKLKTLTGLAPIEFIKEMRVKRAAQLMASGQYNMTQISYMVGINDPRYFSKCFKQFFGLTPTEYKDQLSGK